MAEIAAVASPPVAGSPEVAEATRGLALLELQVASLRAELLGVRRELDESRSLPLQEANAHLVLTALQSFERHAVAMSGRSPADAAARVLAVREPPLLRHLLEANERLLVAVLAAQEHETSGLEARRQQIMFLATVAHELRNPLNPISTAAELLHRARADEPMLAKLQLIIKRQVAHLSRLIEDLLDRSRLGTGRLRLDRQAVAMGDILQLAVDACRPAMDTRGQHLELRWPAEPLRVHGDAVRLTQVFSNLLDNASKYTPEGGEIAMVAVVHGPALAVTVSDSGVGMAAEALPYVFDLFMQEPHALALQQHGLGIGLAVVRELVQAHGGTVIGRSGGHDLGSEFVVTLPLVVDPAPVDRG